MGNTLIIKAYGDPEMCNAIVSGMSGATAVVKSAELEAIRAEIERLRAENAVHAYGHSERLKRALRNVEASYKAVPMNPVTGALLGLWALLWTAIYSACDWASSMTREQ